MIRFASMSQARMWVILTASGDCCCVVNFGSWSNTKKDDYRMEYTVQEGTNKVREKELI